MSYSSGDFHVFEKENLGSSSATPSVEVMVVHEGPTPTVEPSHHPGVSTAERTSLVRRRQHQSPEEVEEGAEGGRKDFSVAIVEEVLEEEAVAVAAGPSSRKGKEPAKEPKESRIAHVKNITVDGEVNTIGSCITPHDLDDIRQWYGIPPDVVLKVPDNDEVACSYNKFELLRLTEEEERLLRSCLDGVTVPMGNLKSVEFLERNLLSPLAPRLNVAAMLRKFEEEKKMKRVEKEAARQEKKKLAKPGAVPLVVEVRGTLVSTAEGTELSQEGTAAGSSK